MHFALLAGCLVLAALVAFPSVARALTHAPTTQIATPISLERDAGISGSIAVRTPRGSFTLEDDVCSDLAVQAKDARGAMVATTKAAEGNVKGQCVFSLKVPADQNLTIGVADVKFAKLRTALDAASKDAAKMSAMDAPSKDAAKMLAVPKRDKWIFSASGDVSVAGRTQKVRLSRGQSLTLPLLVDVTERAP